MEIEVFPGDVTVNLFGYQLQVRETYLGGLLLTALILVFALVFRFIILPRFTTDVKKIKTTQLISELIAEKLDAFTFGAVGSLGEKLSPYILTVGCYLVFSGVVELLGVRSPLSDLTTTLSFGLTTFVLINYYAIRQKGLVHRLRHYVHPNSHVGLGGSARDFLVGFFSLISDLVTPVSLSLRLFGNMLVGFIVMDLLYAVCINSINAMAVQIWPEVLGGIVPGILSIYFVLFHIAIQFYVFSKLSLTFIGEATE